MSIVVCPVGPLRRYSDGQERLLLQFENQDIAQILRDIGIPSEVVAAVLVDERLVSKEYVPQDGDEVKLISILGGG